MREFILGLPDLGDFGDQSNFQPGMECILTGKFIILCFLEFENSSTCPGLILKGGAHLLESFIQVMSMGNHGN